MNCQGEEEKNIIARLIQSILHDLRFNETVFVFFEQNFKFLNNFKLFLSTGYVEFVETNKIGRS